MTTTTISLGTNVLIGLAYLAIAALICRGLLRTGQARRNRLAVATAAIFASCAGGHLLSAAHLAAAGGADGALLGVDVLVWNVATALVAIAFLGMRRGHRRLTGTPWMFDDHQQRAAERRLREQAYRDDVTGLANRAAFNAELERALDRPVGEQPLALLLLDFDGFKHINDSLGHSAGDELLNRAAERIRGAMRPGDFVARLGGDEFTMILPEVGDVEPAGRTADRILAALRDPFDLSSRRIHVTASIGISVRTERPDTGIDEAADLLRQADIAMYRAKRDGKDRHATFQTSMGEEVQDALTLATELRVALDSGDVGVEYQPVVDLETGAVVGLEALVRWYDEDRPRSTEKLIAVAEESGLIVPLGYLVLQRACRQLAALKEQVGAEAMPWVSVNLSSRQLEDPTVADHIEALLTTADVAPDRLVAEITERVAVADNEATAETLGALRLLGVRIAIDDFGTGFSSLGALATLDADILKIDRSFVTDLVKGGATRAVVRTVLELGQALGLEIVAEGIESGVQATGLSHMGCRLGQGWYFGRTAPPEAARRFVAARSLAATA